MRGHPGLRLVVAEKTRLTSPYHSLEVGEMGRTIPRLPRRELQRPCAELKFSISSPPPRDLGIT